MIITETVDKRKTFAWGKSRSHHSRGGRVVIATELTNFVFAISAGPIIEIYASRFRDADYGREIRTKTFACRGHINQVPQCIIIGLCLFHLVSRAWVVESELQLFDNESIL